MDYLGETIALGIDALIFGVCIKQYFKNKNAISMIQVLKLKIPIKVTSNVNTFLGCTFS